VSNAFGTETYKALERLIMSLSERSTSARNGTPPGGPGPPWTALAFAVDGGLDASYSARKALLASDVPFPAEVRDDLLLLVTELVTNAVCHAEVAPGRSLRVELTRSAQRVRVEGSDPGPAANSSPIEHAVPGEGGWGLLLVDRIADRWGMTSRDGTSVWFELRIEG